MNIVVIGAGAVGGYFGGKLAAKGYPVTFLVREKRYQQLKSRGLKVHSIHGDFSIEPDLARNVEDIENPEVVIIAVKNYHLTGALPQIEQLVAKGAKVLPFINGIGHLDLLISNLGKENVIGGLCYVESTLNEEGDVVQTSQLQDVSFGALDQSETHFLSRLAETMRAAEINVTLSHTIVEDMWKKFIFLTSLSGITAAVRQPIGISLEDPVSLQFLQDMIVEIAAVAKAKGAPLADDTAQQILNKLQSISPSMTASMHRDLEKGLPMELDSLHGHVLRLGQEYGVSTPCIRAVYALLHPYKGGAVKAV